VPRARRKKLSVEGAQIAAVEMNQRFPHREVDRKNAQNLTCRDSRNCRPDPTGEKEEKGAENLPRIGYDGYLLVFQTVPPHLAVREVWAAAGAPTHHTAKLSASRSTDQISPLRRLMRGRFRLR